MANSLVLYDLEGADGTRFSPYCWRARMSLVHKGLSFDTVGIKFSDKDKLAFSGQGKVPVLKDGDKVICDSWEIACYLDQAYPDRPALFGSEDARAQARFFNHWTDTVINGAVFSLIILDVWNGLYPEDKAYFRETREARFGKPLEQVQAGREERLASVQAKFGPVALTLKEQPFLCGKAPAFADYCLFGTLRWAQLCSDFEVLAPGSELAEWRARMLAAHNGAAAVRR